MLYSFNFNQGNEASIKLPAMLYISVISPAECFLVRNAGVEGVQDQKEWKVERTFMNKNFFSVAQFWWINHYIPAIDLRWLCFALYSWEMSTHDT